VDAHPNRVADAVPGVRGAIVVVNPLTKIKRRQEETGRSPRNQRVDRPNHARATGTTYMSAVDTTDLVTTALADNITELLGSLDQPASRVKSLASLRRNLTLAVRSSGQVQDRTAELTCFMPVRSGSTELNVGPALTEPAYSSRSANPQ
jgi:hypothetical protein